MKKSVLALAFAAAMLAPLAAAHADVQLTTTPGIGTATPITANEIGTAGTSQNTTSTLNGIAGLPGVNDYYFSVAAGTPGVVYILGNNSTADYISAAIYTGEVIGGLTTVLTQDGPTLTVGPTPPGSPQANISADSVNLAPGTYTLQVSGTAGQPFAANLAGLAPAVSATPEPATWALMMFGVGAIGVAMRRSRRPARNLLVAA